MRTNWLRGWYWEERLDGLRHRWLYMTGQWKPTESGFCPHCGCHLETAYTAEGACLCESCSQHRRRIALGIKSPWSLEPQQDMAALLTPEAVEEIDQLVDRLATKIANEHNFAFARMFGFPFVDGLTTPGLMEPMIPRLIHHVPPVGCWDIWCTVLHWFSPSRARDRGRRRIEELSKP